MEANPDFAPAWAGLAGVYMIQIGRGELSEADGFFLIRETAERALALDSTLPEAHFRMARYYDYLDDREAAAPHWEAARRYGTKNPLILSALAGRAAWDRRWGQAVELQRQAIMLDPLSVSFRHNLAYLLLAAGRLAESREAALATMALRPEKGDDVPRHMKGILVAIGLLEDPTEDILRLFENWPDDAPERDMYAALVYDALGRRAEADEIVKRMTRAEDFLSAVQLAQVFAHRGQNDTAFEWLEIALTRLKLGTSRIQRSNLFSEFHASPFLKRLYDDPRWKQWLEDFLATE